MQTKTLPHRVPDVAVTFLAETPLLAFNLVIDIDLSNRVSPGLGIAEPHVAHGSFLFHELPIHLVQVVMTVFEREIMRHGVSNTILERLH